MTGGWVGRILDVDLTAGNTAIRDSMAFAHDYIGGRGMASRIAWDEIPAGAGPFDPENRIIVATGPLTGTLAPSSGRTIMTSLSPRTYPMPWITHSTLGGWFGAELKYAGFDALVIHGRAQSPVILDIRDGEAHTLGAADLWGLGSREVQLEIKRRLGQEAQVLAIGPAGENLVRFATVQHAEENAAGHSGFGAVWGSKRLKAVAVRGTGGVAVSDPGALLREVLKQGSFQPAPFASVLAVNRSNQPRPVCSQACTFDCDLGSFGHAEDGRRMPGWCIGGRTWVTEDYMKHTAYSGGGLEVPPGRNFGLSTEAPLHELCNSLGLDLWFRLVMQPWFICCRQLGVRRIRGYPIDPDDPAWFKSFMLQLAHREGLGELFAEDLVRAMDDLEGELPEELIRMGRELEFGFGFPAHREGRLWDEEPLPFWVISAMMYASESRDPSIGAHQSSLMLADFLLADPEVARRQFRAMSEQVWGYPDALEPTYDHKAPVAIWSQHQHMLIDSLPLCDFAFPQLVRPMGRREEWLNAEDITGDLDLHMRLFAAVTGLALNREDLEEAAERAFTLERAMLARAGRGRALEESLAEHFALPCRADGTFVDEAGFALLLDEYYAARGWDLEHGWPTVELLERLGLEDVVPEIQARRRALPG
jgi:aldehyde:ferredoxin oxidoreductase